MSETVWMVEELPSSGMRAGRTGRVTIALFQSMLPAAWDADRALSAEILGAEG